VSAIARDISEYLETVDLGTPATPEKLTVAYHAACSLQHGQQIKTTPKALLARAGFEVREPAEGHLCCGSAGTYNMLQPDLSARLRERKVANIEATGAQVVAAGNLGCMTQIATVAGRPHRRTPDWAYGGPRPALPSRKCDRLSIDGGGRRDLPPRRSRRTRRHWRKLAAARQPRRASCPVAAKSCGPPPLRRRAATTRPAAIQKRSRSSEAGVADADGNPQGEGQRCWPSSMRAKKAAPPSTSPAEPRGRRTPTPPAWPRSPAPTGRTGSAAAITIKTTCNLRRQTLITGRCVYSCVGEILGFSTT
jgi:hypothetical protein